MNSRSIIPLRRSAKFSSKDVTVVIPTRNRREALRRSIGSILVQTATPAKILVIDDGSIDDTAAVIEDIRGTTAIAIELVSNGLRCGANAARNLGVQLASTRLIAFQDSDDIWQPNKLERQIEARNGVSVPCLIYTGIQLTRLDGSIATHLPPERIGANGLRERLMCGNFIGTPSVLVDRDLLLNQPFDERLPRLQDWELWIRLSERHPLIGLPEVLVHAYESIDSISRDVALLGPAIEMIYAKYRTEYARWSAARMELFRFILYVEWKNRRLIQFAKWIWRFFVSYVRR